MTPILITGGAGFIGSNFIHHFLDTYTTIQIINMDTLTYASDLNNLKDVKTHPRYKFVKGNICDKAILEDLFKRYNIRGVIHFAAESHVDNSISNPDIFIKTNIIGTFNLLEIAKKHWMEAPFKYKKTFKNCRFHHISTDEVYGSCTSATDLFTETTPYAPNSPYSASKASSDMIVRSYFHTYGLNTVITNCSNNYGPRQHQEKLIPTIIQKALLGKNIPIYGNGSNIRDWLYVTDHCKGIDLVYHKGTPGESYNIGGKNERTNLQVASIICEILDNLMPSNKSYKNLITFVKDRPGHDQRYAIDASKIETTLHWKAKNPFEIGIQETIKWYLKKYKNS